VIASTPAPPYVAVIFTSLKKNDEGYPEMSARMTDLASKQPGFLGMESARNSEGFGITVSYWTDVESIRKWKANDEHLVAQKNGRSMWYGAYRVRICTVDREYSFPRE
jgi:heme-degrading monooxygenase HmoA